MLGILQFFYKYYLLEASLLYKSVGGAVVLTGCLEESLWTPKFVFIILELLGQRCNCFLFIHCYIAFCFTFWHRAQHPWSTCVFNNWWIFLGCIRGRWMACWGIFYPTSSYYHSSIVPHKLTITKSNCFIWGLIDVIWYRIMDFINLQARLKN